MGSQTVDSLIELGERTVSKATKAGGEVAEAVVREGSHLSTKVRMREPELVEEAGSRSLGLRVIIGNRVAVANTSDLTAAGVDRIVEDVIELAKLSQEDPAAGPPDPELLSTAAQWQDLQLFDSQMSSLQAAQGIDKAKAAEQAAFDLDARIINSEGATFSRSAGASALVTSGGFAGGYEGTYASLVVRPVVSDEGGKNRTGFHWSASRFFDQMDKPTDVGEEAARRTLAKLGARKVDTQQAPVVFDPDAARAILGLLGSCINGNAIWRRSSYLMERLNTKVASPLITVIDDPLVPGAPGSRPFDGEGLLSRTNIVVERGVLKTFLVDSYAGRKLGMPSTANASRGGAGSVSVSPTNFLLQPGEMSPDDLVRATPRGLYVTEMMGFGFNGVTGDFSRGASGFWIENGEKAFPVSEVTISLNLDDLLQRIDAVANDLDLRTATASPTFRVSEMTIAGK